MTTVSDVSRHPQASSRRLLIVTASVLLASLWTASAMAQVANNDAYGTVEDQPLSIAAPGVRANDVTLGFLNPVIDWGSPSNGTLTATSPDGAFTYVPSANFNGVDSFTYQLRDLVTGLVSNTATVTIAVSAVNDAPLGVVSRSYSTPEDTALRIDVPGVLAGVTDVESNAISAQLVTTVAPATGTLALSPDGAFTFTPAAGFSGTATFSYRAVDNGVPPAQTAPANVVITVTDVNDVPVANPDSYAASEDTLLTVAAPGVLGNDTDPDVGTQLTAVLATSVPAAAGTLTLNANGSFTFQPASNFSGVTSFTYNARDNAAPPGPKCGAGDGDDHCGRSQRCAGCRRRQLRDQRERGAHGACRRSAGQRYRRRERCADCGARYVLPGSGTLSLSPNGSFSYSPAAGFSGTVTFTYRAVESSTPPAAECCGGHRDDHGEERQRPAGCGRGCVHCHGRYAAQRGGAGRARQRFGSRRRARCSRRSPWRLRRMARSR